MIHEAMCLAFEFPGILIVFFRKTGPALRDTTIEMFKELYPAELIAEETKSQGEEEIVAPNGSRFWFRCLDDWRKLGSTAFGAIFVDEADEITEADFRTLRGRLRGKIGPRRMVLSTNPPNIDHWLHKAFVAEPLVDSVVYHFSMFDNAANLPDGYIEDNLANLSEREQRKYVYGLWGFLGEGDPVYEHFRDSMHAAILTPVRGLPLYRGWDFGYRHPACSMGQHLGTGHTNVLHEVLKTNMDIRLFAQIVKQETNLRFPGYEVIDFCDIAGKQKNLLGTTAIQELRKAGIWPRFKKLPLLKSIEEMRYLIRTTAYGRPLLQFDSRFCRLTVEAFGGGYAWDPDKDEPEKDPEGFYDDIADAVRYWVIPVNRGLAQPASEPLPARVAV